MSLPFTPVIIAGAARSGTNMLRDMLSRLPGFATWPCDEINPIWRHRNRGWPDDELPAMLAGRGRRYIRQRFTRLWRHAGKPPFVVEKTCANTLRLPFVATVLPEARFIQIVRDGIDVVPSAERRWRGDLEFGSPAYFLAKSKFVPISDLPATGLEFIRNRLPGLLGRSGKLRVWGPRFAGLEAVLAQPLAEICARQWVACTDRSDAALAALPRGSWLQLRYENILADPKGAVRQVAAFLLADQVGRNATGAAAAIVRPNPAIGAPIPALPPGTLDILKATRQRHGYVE